MISFSRRHNADVSPHVCSFVWWYQYRYRSRKIGKTFMILIMKDQQLSKIMNKMTLNILFKSKRPVENRSSIEKCTGICVTSSSSI